MLDVGELALLLARGAADLGVDFDVAHLDVFLLRDRLEDQRALHALDRLGTELLADLPPVDLRLLAVDALRGEVARVVVAATCPSSSSTSASGTSNSCAASSCSPICVALEAQRFGLAMAADVAR